MISFFLYHRNKFQDGKNSDENENLFPQLNFFTKANKLSDNEQLKNLQKIFFLHFLVLVSEEPLRPVSQNIS